ncbi:MAG: BatA domain-containing protein [Phycisphaerae bacterium]
MIAFSFAQPALLLGIAVCVVPFLLHFLLRPRPKRIVFPAMALFRHALATGQRARRLQDYRLLAVRMALLALAATLLAAPTCEQPQTTVERGPRAIAVVLDDSWSTSYRLDETTVVSDLLRDAARRTVQSWASDPHAVSFALIRNGPGAATLEPTADRTSLLPVIESLGSGPPHARGLAAAIQQAARQLQTARQPTRELVIFTDGAAHAWSDMPARALDGVSGTSVRIITPPTALRTNLAIRGVSIDPLGGRDATPIPLAATVQATGVSAQASLVARMNGREVARVSPIALDADAAVDVDVLIPPQPIGRHALSIELEPMDRLPHDQTHFAVIEVRARPIAWLIEDADAAQRETLAVTILRNLLAPDTLDPAAQAVALRRVSADRELPSATEATPSLIIAPSGVAITDAQAELIRKSIEAGSTLVLACTSDSADVDWPGLRTLLSTRVPRVELLDAVTSIAAGADADADAIAGLKELSRCTIRRRVRLGEMREGVSIDAYFADDEPAIVSRRMGRGRVVLIATSADPAWSELGLRAAGLLEWLHGLMRSGDESQRSAAFIAGTQIEALPMVAADRTSISISRMVPADSRQVSVRMVDGKAEPRLPSDLPGVYGVRAASADVATAAYAVNWPIEEAELVAIEPERVRQLLGVDAVSFETTESIGEKREQATIPQMIDPKLPIAALLLAALFAEMWQSRNPRAMTN